MSLAWCTFKNGLMSGCDIKQDWVDSWANTDAARIYQCNNNAKIVLVSSKGPSIIETLIRIYFPDFDAVLVISPTAFAP